MADRTVRVRFLGQDISLGSTMRGAAGDADKLAGKTEASSKRMSGAMTGALLGASSAVVAFGTKAVKAALEGERSTALLDTAIRNAGDNVAKVTPRVDALSEHMAKYGYVNDEVEAALARVTTATGNSNRAIDLMGTVADVAAARHMSLEKAADLVSKVVNGNVGSLSRYGIATKDSTGKTLSSAQALDLLAKKYHGASEEIAKTPAGKIKAFQAELDNFEEKVGNQVLPLLTRGGTAVLDVVTGMERAFDSLPGPMKVVLEVGAGLAAGGYAISKSYGFVKDAIGTTRGIFKDVGTLARKAGDAISSSSKVAETGVTDLTTSVETQSTTIAESSATSSASISTIGSTAEGTAATVTGSTAEIDGSISTIGTTAEETAVVTGEAFTGIGGEAETLAATIEEAKAASNVGTWGGGGFGGPGGVPGPPPVGTPSPTPETPMPSPLGRFTGLLEGGALAGAYGAWKFKPTAASDVFVKTNSVGSVKKEIGRLSDSGSSKEEIAQAGALAASLERLKGIHVDVATAADREAGAHRGAAGATRDHTAATDRDTTANTKNAESADHMVKRLGEYQDTLKAITDPVFAAVHAQDQLTKSKLEVMAATQDVDKAEREHGRNSDEYRQAVARLTDANQQQVESALGQQSAMAGLEAAFANGSVSADKMRITLQGWVAQGLITQAQADQQIRKMGLLKATADRIDGTAVRVKASFDDADARRGMLDFIGAVDRVKARVAGGIHAIAASVAAQMPTVTSPPKKTKALGGHGAPVDGVTLVGEQGPELVVFDRPGTVIPAGRTAQILAADSEARTRLGIQGFADGGRYQVASGDLGASPPTLRQMRGWSPYEGDWKVAFDPKESKNIARLLAAFAGIAAQDVHKRRIGFPETRSVEDVFYGSTYWQSDMLISGLVERDVRVYDRELASGYAIDPRMRDQAVVEAPGQRMLLISHPGGPGLKMFGDGGRPPLHTDVVVGERGPEVARFDRPATIYPNGVTPPAAPVAAPVAVAGGAAPVNITMSPGAVVVHVDRDMSDHEAADLVARGFQKWAGTYRAGPEIRLMIGARA